MSKYLNIYNNKIIIVNYFIISFIILYLSNSSFIVFRLYLSTIILFVLFGSIIKKQNIIYDKLTLSLLLIVTLNILFSTKLNYDSIYILLFSVLLVLLPYFQHQILLNRKNFDKYIIFSFYFIYAFSLLFLIFDLEFGNSFYRFSGFSNSATTYSTYILVFYTFFLFLSNKSNQKIFFAIFTFVLIYYSKTRTSLLVFVIVSLVYLLKDIKIVKSKTTFWFICTLIFSVLLYPLVEFITSYINIDISGRSETGQLDYSTLTRLSLFQNQINSLTESTLFQLIFGNGIKSSEYIFFRYARIDIEQHNDYFTLIYDFGLLYFGLFVLMIKRLVKNVLTVCLITIYLFSFYHNMVFDIFIVSCLFISSKIDNTYE